MRFGTAIRIGSLLILSAPCAAQPPGEQATSPGEYRLTGAEALKPGMIWDDGYRTYIVWSPEAELPAVFSRGPDGNEVIADGAMRGDRYVLDRVHSMLIFRIDRASATARRKAGQHE